MQPALSEVETVGSIPSLVSVIVPVYNAESTLRRCLDSILRQNYPAMEILLVNDGSKDGSLSVLKEYEQLDSRVKVYSQLNGGVSSARNLALEHALGTYVQFVDSDDVLLPGSTAEMVHAMESQGCDMVIAAYNEVLHEIPQRRGFLKTDMVLSQQSLLDKLCAHPNSFYYAVLWNKLYRREVVVENDIRFHLQLPWGEDFVFNMQYMRHVRQAAVLAKPVYDYFRNLNGLALATGLRTVLHPVRAIRVKLTLHRHYRQLYIDTGLYEQYRHVLPQYLFKVTINQ